MEIINSMLDVLIKSPDIRLIIKALNFNKKEWSIFYDQKIKHFIFHDPLVCLDQKYYMFDRNDDLGNILFSSIGLDVITEVFVENFKYGGRTYIYRLC
jgi:hypothetical protein